MKKRARRLRATPQIRDDLNLKPGGNLRAEIGEVLSVFFVNIGLRRNQETASRFFVHLKVKLSCSEIEERLAKAFGDLQ